VAAAPVIQPGDVIAVRTPDFFGGLIRLGAALRGLPDLSNHIAVAHHRDARGTLWVIEGRPGGTGWRQAGDYLRDRRTLTNADQPKTDAQRAAVCATMLAMVGCEYDWEAIAADAAADLHFDWQPVFGAGVPAHVVCSSLACYAYDEAKLARPPGNARTDQPADWDSWILERGWVTPPRPSRM
jgi:hypothetical protein